MGGGRATLPLPLLLSTKRPSSHEAEQTGAGDQEEILKKEIKKPIICQNPHPALFITTRTKLSLAKAFVSAMLSVTGLVLRKCTRRYQMALVGFQVPAWLSKFS